MVGGVTPSAFGGSFSSANVIFPLARATVPTWSARHHPLQPLATRSLRWEPTSLRTSFRPVLNVASNALTYAVGGSQVTAQPIWEQLIPNATVQRLVQAYAGDDRAFSSSVMQAYQYLDYEQAKATEAWEKGGEKGPVPTIVPPQNAPAHVKQAFIDKVRNYVRWLYVAGALTGAVSPVSSSVEITNFGFPANQRGDHQGGVGRQRHVQLHHQSPTRALHGVPVLRAVRRRLVAALGLLAGFVPAGRELGDAARRAHLRGLSLPRQERVLAALMFWFALIEAFDHSIERLGMKQRPPLRRDVHAANKLLALCRLQCLPRSWIDEWLLRISPPPPERRAS